MNQNFLLTNQFEKCTFFLLKAKEGIAFQVIKELAINHTKEYFECKNKIEFSLPFESN